MRSFTLSSPTVTDTSSCDPRFDEPDAGGQRPGTSPVEGSMFSAQIPAQTSSPTRPAIS